MNYCYYFHCHSFSFFKVTFTALKIASLCKNRFQDMTNSLKGKKNKKPPKDLLCKHDSFHSHIFLVTGVGLLCAADLLKSGLQL